MTLQRHLTWWLLVLLVPVSGFVAFSAWSFATVEGFFVQELAGHLEMARTYERLVAHWLTLDDQGVTGSILPFGRGDIPASLLEPIQRNVAELDRLARGPTLSPVWPEIKGTLASYVRGLERLRELRSRRQELARTEAGNRRTLFLTLGHRAVAFQMTFQQLIRDLSPNLRLPEAQSGASNANQPDRAAIVTIDPTNLDSWGGEPGWGSGLPEAAASRLVHRLRRVEGDLRMIQDGIAQYVAPRSDATDEEGRPLADIGNGIEQRFRAVIGLLDATLARARIEAQRRALRSVIDKLRAFHSEFVRIRIMGETPDTERIDLDDQIRECQLEVAKLRKSGIGLATEEANRWWRDIDMARETLRKRLAIAASMGRWILFFSVVLAIGGIMLLPHRISTPVLTLCRRMTGLEPGSMPRPIQPTRIEEIDRLGSAFVEMAERVKQSMTANGRYLAAIGDIWNVFAGIGLSTRTGPNSDRIDVRPALDQLLALIREHLLTPCPPGSATPRGEPRFDVVKILMLPPGATGDRPSRHLQPLAEWTSDRFRHSSSGEHYRRTTPEQAPLPIDKTVSGWIFDNGLHSWSRSADVLARTGFPLPVEDCARSGDPAAMESALPQYYVALPLRASDAPDLLRPELLEPNEGDTPIGMLVAYATDPEPTLTAPEMDFLWIVARQITTTLRLTDVLNRHEQLRVQFQLAKEVQRSILPRTTPTVPGLQIDHCWRMAYEVGGDYFDLLPLPGNRLGVAIADVSGKGIPAALSTMMIRTLLLAYDADAEQPGQLLTKMNDVLLKQAQGDAADGFVTMAFAVIDPAHRTLVLALAGHPPGLRRFRSNGKLKLARLEAQGPPLGIVSFTYQERRYIIESGDLIMFYTDGVTECRNRSGKEFESESLKKFLVSYRGTRPAGDLLDELLRFSRERSESGDEPEQPGTDGSLHDDLRLHDDITVVAIQMVGMKSA